MTFGQPVPGARSPRSSGHGSSTDRTALTAANGNRMSPCNTLGLLERAQVEHQLVAVDL